MGTQEEIKLLERKLELLREIDLLESKVHPTVWPIFQPAYPIYPTYTPTQPFYTTSNSTISTTNSEVN